MLSRIINIPMLKQPMNYFTVGFMLLFLAILGHLVMSYLGIEPATEMQN